MSQSDRLQPLVGIGQALTCAYSACASQLGIVLRTPRLGSDVSGRRSLIRTDGLEGAVLGGEVTHPAESRQIRAGVATRRSRPDDSCRWATTE